MLFTKVLVVLITLAATSPVLGGGPVTVTVTVPECSTPTNPPPPPTTTSEHPPTTTTSEHPPTTTTSEHPPTTTWEPPHTTSVPGQNGGNACGNGGVQHCCNSLGVRLPNLLSCSILSGVCDNGNVYCCNNNNQQTGTFNINAGNCMSLF